MERLRRAVEPESILSVRIRFFHQRILDVLVIHLVTLHRGAEEAFGNMVLRRAGTHAAAAAYATYPRRSDCPATPAIRRTAHMQSVAAQRPFFFDHIAPITDRAMVEFFEFTGRQDQRVSTYRAEDAEYPILGQGSMIVTAAAVVGHLRETRGIKAGVVNLTMFRPFAGDLLGEILRGRKGVTVLERVSPYAAPECNHCMAHGTWDQASERA
jgi:pyruvate/2-oxoacid:ferredoxin oxidoreductase alpha subunit